jgi:hypothetical protein
VTDQFFDRLILNSPYDDPARHWNCLRARIKNGAAPHEIGIILRSPDQTVRPSPVSSG